MRKAQALLFNQVLRTQKRRQVSFFNRTYRVFKKTDAFRTPYHLVESYYYLIVK